VLIRAGLGFLLGPIRNKLIQTALGDIRAAIYDSLQRLAFSYHDKTNSGELISRSTADVFRLQDFFFACLLLSFDIVVSLIAIIWLIWIASPVLAAITVATAAPTIGLIAFYASKLRPQWRLVHDQHGADDHGDPGEHRRGASSEGVCEGTRAGRKVSRKKSRCSWTRCCGR
jgi:ATP-binding cassette subfamily B protein